MVQPRIGFVSDPGNMSVGPDQDGSGSSDLAQYWKLPPTSVFRVNQLDAITPSGDLQVAGLTEVEQHGPSIMQQREDAHRAVGRDQVEVGHAAPEQRMSPTEAVMNVQ